MDQDAGFLTQLEMKSLVVQGTEVFVLQEVSEALVAERVSAGRVERLQQGLKADVADEVVVHFALVVVQVVFFCPVLLATLKAQGVQGGGRGGLLHGRHLITGCPHCESAVLAGSWVQRRERACD